jgi:hypothetical protein
LSIIEESILESVNKLLTERVNEILGEGDVSVPPVEWGWAGYAVVPVISLSTCERTEKERIIRLDAYSLTITFTVPEQAEGERNCYAYAWVAAAALGEDPTLGGIASRAVLAGKKYIPPKRPGTGGVDRYSDPADRC